ncbi:Na+/H+ antiporter subunit E [Halostagnicola sp. A-GB9-2]|uniref:Na+/H+ antiporter subunit E n=1 Tax=Halostagnicola sp. A-GB9-2 TaxID=3048066 RepID=UPI0024C00AD3|nr:Na+/H+ antiporter subunit E [Halostagnicola sp. A-GB9-2]MDJ1431004.1 Na+/H+ antiporter subunit E [Halostagnicola sp. A-GB9-2]
MNVRTWPVASLVFAALWVFIRGVELAPAALVGQFLFGLVVGLPVAFVFRRLYVKRIDLQQGVYAAPYAGRYAATFVAELIRANFDVAYRVLAPDPRIEPEVILIPLRVRSDIAVTIIANSITITPGTVTLDHDPETNALYVHVIDGRDLESVVEPIRTWETYALEMFTEKRSPDDPAPEIIVDGGTGNE